MVIAFLFKTLQTLQTLPELPSELSGLGRNLDDFVESPPQLLVLLPKLQVLAAHVVDLLFKRNFRQAGAGGSTATDFGPHTATRLPLQFMQRLLGCCNHQGKLVVLLQYLRCDDCWLVHCCSHNKCQRGTPRTLRLVAANRHSMDDAVQLRIARQTWDHLHVGDKVVFRVNVRPSSVEVLRELGAGIIETA